MRLSRRAALIGASMGLASCATPFARRTAGPSANPWDTSPWDPGVGAFEHGDSARTSIFENVDPFGSAGVAPSAERASFPTPGIWSVAFDSNGNGYALHGVIGGAPGSDRPRLSAFDPYTLTERWRIDLPLAEGPYWNYPGGIGVTANGSLYAAYSTRLAQIDVRDGSVLGVRDLPAPAGRQDTAYNGFIALSDGRLLLKSHHRKANCPHQGYRALIECGVDGLPPSALVLIDPNDLAIAWSGSAPEFIGGRISAVGYGGREFVYLAGATRVHRLVYDGASLARDSRWPSVAYCEGAETPGTAVVGFGDFVVVQNNAVPASAPLRLTIISQADSGLQRSLRPFQEEFSGRSFMPSKSTADLKNRRLYTSDAHGALAAIDFDRRNGLRIAWKSPVRTGSFIPALGPHSDRVLVASDIQNARFDEWGAPVHAAERIVWLDAAHGAELSAVAEVPRSFGLTLTPNRDGSIFVATRTGGLWRLRPGRRAKGGE